MADTALKIELRFDNALVALADAADSWTKEKRDEFCEEWRRLEHAGAHLIDMNGLVAFASEDFTMHLKKWGVHLW